MSQPQQLDAVFSALANPTRRAILARLIRGEASVNTLAEPFDMSLPAISKHIQTLENADLIYRRKEAQARICSINPTTIEAVSHWAEQYRPIWEGRFDAMDEMITMMKEPKNG